VHAEMKVNKQNGPPHIPIVEPICRLCWQEACELCLRVHGPQHSGYHKHERVPSARRHIADRRCHGNKPCWWRDVVRMGGNLISQVCVCFLCVGGVGGGVWVPTSAIKCQRALRNVCCACGLWDLSSWGSERKGHTPLCCGGVWVVVGVPSTCATVKPSRKAHDGGPKRPTPESED
jgi:hypothetical protein